MASKFQEALDIVNERFDYMNEELHPNKHYLKPQFSLDTLQELVDKETPKKVIVKKPYVIEYYSCPNCKAELAYGNTCRKVDFCEFCGQALDWRNDE